MSFKSVFVFLCSYIWYYKCKTLPKLYFQLSKKINIPVNEFRDYERAINSFAKLQLDIQYFKDCEFLEILPKFLRVKTPKLKVYDAIHSDIRTTVLRKQVALLSKELHTKRIILQSKKKKISTNTVMFRILFTYFKSKCLCCESISDYQQTSPNQIDDLMEITKTFNPKLPNQHQPSDSYHKRGRSPSIWFETSHTTKISERYKRENCH